MILNAVLLVFVLGVKKLRRIPYLPAAVFGLVKAIIYFAYTKRLAYSSIAGCVFAALVAAFIFFLLLLEKRQSAERPEVPTYDTPGAERTKFRWEYFPLSALAIVIVAGELLIPLLFVVR